MHILRQFKKICMWEKVPIIFLVLRALKILNLEKLKCNMHTEKCILNSMKSLKLNTPV